MRAAYLILSHRRPSQLIRLIEVILRQDAHAVIVVHHDQFRSEVDKSMFEQFSNVYLLTSDYPIEWGDFSQVDVYWRSLTWMLEHVEFDWVIFLSAQDYPIKPLHMLYRHLNESGVDAFVDGCPIDEIQDSTTRRDAGFRYNYQYRILPDLQILSRFPSAIRRPLHNAYAVCIGGFNRVQPFFHVYRYPAPLPSRIGSRARRRPFTASAPCWKSSSWLTMNHRAAEAVVRFTVSNADYVRYYRSTVVPDESATATIVANDPELTLVRHGIHHINWSGIGRSHPEIFTESNLQELVASDQYFARKFDETVDSVILDRLDDLLSGGSTDLLRLPRE